VKLALFGGKPVRTELFPEYRVIDNDEKEAANRVLDSQVLSRYLGCWHEDFYGGSEVQALEAEWAKYFGAKHALAVNSCTSGLYCAVGATGVEPGEEIIVSPYTMCASATAPLIFNAIPVFADIENDFYCLDPASVEEKITPRTRAIIVVDIFGLPYDSEAINRIAKKHGLIVIEDAAQAPGAYYKGKYAGTLGDIGVYSLNYHKHIHCGEGGIIVTDNDELAEKMRLIRNHAEAVVEGHGIKNIENLIGFNFRLPEIESAITRSQLKKLKGLIEERQRNCTYLADRLVEIPAISSPEIRENCTHSFYTHSFKFDDSSVGFHRDLFIEAVRAELPATKLREGEGPLISVGYVKPLYLQPMFQKKIVYGSKGFPFNNPWCDIKTSYEKGICPVTERLHEKELFQHELMRPGMTKADLDDVLSAFSKVWENKHELELHLSK
jgi:dTDP-4-amino-4,6-dideoxygalactose transaminase